MAAVTHWKNTINLKCDVCAMNSQHLTKKNT